MTEDLRATRHHLSLQPKIKGVKKPTEAELKTQSFKNSALIVDKDPRVDEYIGHKEEKYIYNIGYNQTTNPVLRPTAEPEFQTKTGYYGKGVYNVPTGLYQDHPIFHDMRKNNHRFRYQQGLTDNKIADDIVTEDKEKWEGTRDMRVLSSNFTSLSKGELERIALRKSMKISNSVANLNPHTELMSKDINPYDSAMRASAYNPYGKLLGKPHLKTPARVDMEVYNSIESRNGLNTHNGQNTHNGYNTHNEMESRGGMMTQNTVGTRQQMHSSYAAPNTGATDFSRMEHPKTFHDQQTQRAMHLGSPGQKFTYAALNSEVENSIIRSRFPAVQPFHMRMSMNKIPTTGMSANFLPTTQGQRGFVTSAYNSTGIKPSTRLEPLNEGLFDKDGNSNRGPLPTTALNQPAAIYILHYASRNEESVVRYFMDSMITEKNIFRYTIPRDPTTCQISPAQLFI